MEDATQASQQPQKTELAAAQDTITRITQELAASHKESEWQNEEAGRDDEEARRHDEGVGRHEEGIRRHEEEV